MTSPTSGSPLPLMPPRSTEARLEHFDETVFKADPTSAIYKLVDAICGDGGAGSLKKGAFVSRLGLALESIYFSDLDYIFGNMSFLSRYQSESYTYDPNNDMLTSEQWDEVRIKDAWFRARIKDFFIAVGMGGTPDGLRMAVVAALSVEADLFEVWRYMDSFGLTANLGRAPVPTRAEVVVKPHKTSITRKEYRLLRDMIGRVAPEDTVVTINTGGLAVATPIGVQSVAADSSYYEVQKVVTATPILADLPAPELLAIDLKPTEQWMFSKSPELAPYSAFNITQEYGYCYLVSGGPRSPIDSVQYGTLNTDSQVVPEPDYESFETVGEYTDWAEYDRADSPDNYPGGKFGLTPSTVPALNPDRTPYDFPYENQAQYIAELKSLILSQGGIADDQRFRLPIKENTTTKTVYKPELAIAYNPPVRDTTVTSSWTAEKNDAFRLNLRDPFSFIKSWNARITL